MKPPAPVTRTRRPDHRSDLPSGLRAGTGRNLLARRADPPDERAMNEPRWRVPLADVIVDDERVQAALATLRSGWGSMGPRVEEFEREFARFCGAGHAVAVANGSAA